jgi:ABC-type sugar transport system, periplasmic component
MFKAKKLLLVLCVILTLVLVTACGSNSGQNNGSNTSQGSTQTTSNAGTESTAKSNQPAVVNFYAGLTEDSAIQNYKTVLDGFSKEFPNIKVNLNIPGKEYENIMKVKMASKDMPDVFHTHGWAKARYGDFLVDLRDQEWASKLTFSIKDFLTDESGKVYGMPIFQEKSGIFFNADILKKYNIEVPKTWDEFTAACETIKTKSGGEIIPVHIGGADSWTLGCWYDVLANPLLISPQDNSASALLDGSFDWSKWDFLSQQLVEFYKKGFINKDAVTAKYTDTTKLMAEGKTCFTFDGSGMIPEVKRMNPDIHFGVSAIPSIAAGDTPVWSGGEGDTLGVWKNSKYLDAAKTMVAYFARPENIKTVIGTRSVLPGLEGVDVDLGELGPYYDAGKDLRMLSVFDRLYLPNGMWDVMCKNAQDLLAGGISVKQYSENMKTEYLRLRASNNQ